MRDLAEGIEVTQDCEVAVVGGGPAGLTASLALASAGVPTVLVSGRRTPDNRTTALLASSVTALETLGVWARCRAQAAPLKVLRLVDATRRLWRAPEARFAAEEIGLDAFGWNIENGYLIAALAARAQALPALAIVDDEAQAIEIGPHAVEIALAGGGRVRARLAVGADGRHSLCRAAAGIASERRTYPQTALTFNLRHSRPHHDTSTEFHTEQGPFTLVPLPGLRSSLVCVVAPEEADRVLALADAALAADLECRAHSLLGKFTVEAGRGAFALAVETARHYSSHRVALIGEAAHVIPPIGAQGLNLGLRDAATIAEFAAAARQAGGDVGAPDVTARYDRQRRADVTSRMLVVDLLNRTLLSDLLAVQGARGLALYLLDRVGPLRRALMREGVAPAAGAPRLMRGEAL